MGIGDAVLVGSVGATGGGGGGGTVTLAFTFYALSTTTVSLTTGGVTVATATLTSGKYLYQSTACIKYTTTVALRILSYVEVTSGTATITGPVYFVDTVSIVEVKNLNGWGFVTVPSSAKMKLSIKKGTNSHAALALGGTTKRTGFGFLKIG